MILKTVPAQPQGNQKLSMFFNQKTENITPTETHKESQEHNKARHDKF